MDKGHNPNSQLIVGLEVMFLLYRRFSTTSTLGVVVDSAFIFNLDWLLSLASAEITKHFRGKMMKSSGDAGDSSEASKRQVVERKHQLDGVATAAAADERPSALHKDHDEKLCDLPFMALAPPSLTNQVQQQQPQPIPTMVQALPATTAALLPTRILTAQERENFLLFCKILFKILDEANEPQTRQRAKRIVLECRQRNQQGDPNFHPLMDAIEPRLRNFVGETSWKRAHVFMQHFLQCRRGRSFQSSSSARTMNSSTRVVAI